MASVEERFQAAVNVIKGLPKNGPYQPSTSMMLKFYGLYKQGTEGACHQKKPNFWDIVGKAKWDAWSSNRHLSKQQAMEKYVEELREIIETMSFTENVQNFVGSLSGLDNINLDELEMVYPGMRELAESHPNSPFNSRTNSPHHGTSTNGQPVDEEQLSPTLNGHSTRAQRNMANGHSGDTSDTTSEGGVVVVDPRPVIGQRPAAPLPPASTSALSSVDQSDDEYGDPVDMNHELTEAIVHNSELLKQIQATVLRMNADLVGVNQRMSLLDKTVQEVRTSLQKSAGKAHTSANGRPRVYPKWWPFDDISPAWFVLLVLWPFVVKRLSRMLITPRRK